MGKRSLRRLLRGRAGRAWSQTTGGRKKALFYRSGFHSLTCLLTLPITNVFCFYVFVHKNQIMPICLKVEETTFALTLQNGNGSKKLTRPQRHALRREEGASVGQRRFVGGRLVDPTRSAALGGPRERRFVGPAAGPHGVAHAFWRPSAALRWRGGETTWWRPRVLAALGSGGSLARRGRPSPRLRRRMCPWRTVRPRAGRTRPRGAAFGTAIVDTIIEENAAYETKATPAPSPPRR